ncbi:sulfatase [Halosquirtibacter xylanolyticus]|uniref:sulfatase family protein n=1 Tax=Halosquirtibacter xylanolyticus TaxID=3374599 RepID=UPI003748A63A|nr:sulfatase [Prolixibacteraceae bacterium]
MNKNLKSLCVIASTILLGACHHQESKRPNILFVMADDHTSQAWGIYGGVLKDYVHNPNIERLANQGMVFDNCMCTNSICVPSRASIMTGTYSHVNQVYMLRDRLDPERQNVAKLLRANGYQTALIGKWHLKSKPSGFDYFNVLHDQGRYWDPILKTTSNWEEGAKGGAVYSGFSTDVITDLTINWLKHRDQTKPFMMMCHFKATHEPFDYPERFKDLYKDQEIPYPSTLLDFDKDKSGRTYDGQQLENLAWRWEKASEAPDKWWCKYPGLPFTTEGLDSIEARKKVYQKLVKDFMRCGAAIDDNIGRLLDYLEDAGLAENTIVVYTADQGYFLGEHGFFDKRMIAEESLHMPMVVRYPKEIKGGTRNKELVLNIDFPAMFADYAGVVKPDWMQGNSFRPLLRGEHPKSWRTSMYYRYWEHAPIRPGHFGVRNDRYKLAFYYGVPMDADSDVARSAPQWEFYDLEKDPKELHNVYHTPAYQTQISIMKKELIRLRKEVGDTDHSRPWIKEVVQEAAI